MTADIRKKEFHSTINHDCLICSGQIKVSKRNCFGIFDKHAARSGTPLYAVIARILELEIREDSVHSNVICKLCLKKLNEVDEMEVKIQELKEELNASYQESIKMLNEVNINPPEECKINRKMPLQFAVAAREENIKREIRNSKVEANNEIINYVQQECAKQEKNVVTEEGEMLDEIPPGDVSDTICKNDTQEKAAANGECTDDMEEMGAGGDDDDPDYIPNTEVDTNTKVLITSHEKSTFKMTNNAKVSIPEKLVERDGIYFVCLLCNDHKITGDRKGIVCHLKDVHNIRVFICEICLQYFKKRKELSEHLDKHVATEEGEFLCEVCCRIFRNVRGFEVHKRIHFPQVKMWTCEICGKNYYSRVMLEEHMNTHSGLRPYVCEECGKAFASRYTYQAHKKIHENRERSFSCDQCGKAFFRATSLKQHERTHSGMRNYICEQCGKSFITARYLEVHSIIHTGYKPFICRMCGKEFARRAEMVNHERTHTGEKPYQCELCGATFSQRSNLQSHKRATHFQDKRYKCALCDKGFKRQRLLDYHTRAAHTGERPYKCETCSAAFIYPHHFKKHIRLHMAKV